MAEESTERPESSSPGAPGGIDIEKLADKVYQLIRAEIRLNQSRGQTIIEREKIRYTTPS